MNYKVTKEYWDSIKKRWIVTAAIEGEKQEFIGRNLEEAHRLLDAVVGVA